MAKMHTKIQQNVKSDIQTINGCFTVKNVPMINYTVHCYTGSLENMLAIKGKWTKLHYYICNLRSMKGGRVD